MSCIVDKDVATAWYLSGDYHNAPEKQLPDRKLRDLIAQHRKALIEMELPIQLYGVRLVEEEVKLPLLPHVFTSPVKAAQWVKKEYKGMLYSVVVVTVD